MEIFQQHIRHAAGIIKQYDGSIPFSLWLKNFFSQQKKYGSKDRKHISHLCYCYFRTSSLLKDKPAAERILAGLFLCAEKNNELLLHLKPEWNELAAVSIKEKCAVLGIEYSSFNLFPFLNNISHDIDKEAFCLSHLQQPDVFIRTRPGYKDTVIKKLEAAAITYSLLNDTCIAVSATTKIDTLLDLDKEAVIQDYSSQRTGELMQLTGNNAARPLSVWDCCAASGGKSILAKDILGAVNLTVSDIRKSILVNLQKRFAAAGIKNYTSFVTNLSHSLLPDRASAFELIIADVPCSGSGTWGRTPEQLSFFNESAIDEYSSLQKKIVSNIIPSLKEDGYLLYITCSVFEKENEEQVRFIKEKFQLELVKMQVLKGYTVKADTMFAALFRLIK
jgi:16S rRNA (cytosine967-C5)-methyltransferase